LPSEALPRRIDAQNDARDVLPGSTLRLGIERGAVCLGVPLVVSGKDGCGRRDIVNCAGITPSPFRT
jgi:hypothetical protein